MAEAVLSFVTERIGELLIEEVRLLHGVDGQVEQIRDELRMMQAFLKDADAKQNQEERFRIWVTDVRNLAYDAGDVVERFIVEVASRRGGGIKNILKRYVCMLNECMVLHKVGSDIEDMKSRISTLAARLQTYGIRSLSEGEGSTSANVMQNQLRQTYSHVGEEDDFVGLQADVDKLVAKLVSDQEGDKCYRVVSICGMGGLGKTTLAKRIYNHPDVKHHFDASAWVCISQQWQPKDILQQLLSKLTGKERREDEDLTKLSNGQLMENIFNVQENRRCLIVLDDIWSMDDWKCLEPAFPLRNMTSKLLLTSRYKEVATHVDREGFLHEPRSLNEDECCELLKKKALTKRDPIDPVDAEKMEKFGSKMVKHCGGLPLAVVVLGGILATKRSLREWETVCESINSYIWSGEGIGGHSRGVSDILALSYNELPYPLKPCFLYLGKFFEDSNIEAERLYQFWMAESLIRSEDRRGEETMMDVAESYLGELAHRCMVQVQLEEKEPEFRKYKSCRLHDLMREMCLDKAKEEDFFKSFDQKVAESSSSSTNKIRRVVIYYDGKNRDVPPFHKETSHHIRSLLLLNESWEYYKGPMPRIVKSYLGHFKLLRVLVIEGIDSHLVMDQRGESLINGAFHIPLEFYMLPKAVGNLIHLRFLSLRGSSFLMFPSSISNLKHLQTLDLRGYFLFYQPCVSNVLHKMGQLRHLYLPDDIDDSHNVKATNLRLNGLRNLETLENFNPTWCDTKDLLKLTNLRKVTATVKEQRGELERIIDWLINITPNHLRHSSLSITDSDIRKAEGILGRLFQCGSLHDLEINGHIGNLVPHDIPHGIPTTSLTALALSNCEIEEDPMPTLENFPNLRELNLMFDAYKGKEMVCSAIGFPQLKSLIFGYLYHLEKWRVDKGAMPNLLRLVIYDCEKLEMVPDGLRFVTTLRELKIIHMPEEFKKRVRVVDGEEGEDFHKIRLVPSISII